jgi:hypothetical protein
MLYVNDDDDDDDGCEALIELHAMHINAIGLFIQVHKVHLHPAERAVTGSCLLTTVHSSFIKNHPYH